MSHFTRINESRHTYKWVTSHIWMSHITHSDRDAWRDSFICVTPLIYACDMPHSHVWHDSFMCVTRLFHMCDMTHSYVWRDSCISVTWLVPLCAMTVSYVWCDSFRRVTWLIHTCDVTHSYVWRENKNEGCHTYELIMSRRNESYHTYKSIISHTCNVLQHHTATHCNTLQHTAKKRDLEVSVQNFGFFFPRKTRNA